MKDAIATKGNKTKAAQTATKEKNKSLTDANKALATNKAKEKASAHPIKYIYPDDCTTKAQRKAFRRNARHTKNKLEDQIKTLQASNEAADQKELNKISKEFKSFEKTTYINPADN